MSDEMFHTSWLLHVIETILVWGRIKALKTKNKQTSKQKSKQTSWLLLVDETFLVRIGIKAPWTISICEDQSSKKACPNDKESLW